MIYNTTFVVKDKGITYPTLQEPVKSARLEDIHFNLRRKLLQKKRFTTDCRIIIVHKQIISV